MNQAAQQISPRRPAQRLADKIRARTNNGIATSSTCCTTSQCSGRLRRLQLRPRHRLQVSLRQRLRQRPKAEILRDRPRTRTKPPASTNEPHRLQPTACNEEHSANHPGRSRPIQAKACPKLADRAREAITRIDRPTNTIPSVTSTKCAARREYGCIPRIFRPLFYPRLHYRNHQRRPETLVDVLVDIAFAADDDSKVTPYCRSQAGRILSDRSNGTDPASVRNGLCPVAAEPGQPTVTPRRLIRSS